MTFWECLEILEERLGKFRNVLGAFGGVWDRLGAFGSSWSVLERLNAFRRMRAFGRLRRLGRLGKHNPIWLAIKQ